MPMQLSRMIFSYAGVLPTLRTLASLRSQKKLMFATLVKRLVIIERLTLNLAIKMVI